jgi:hypothetical protein
VPSSRLGDGLSGDLGDALNVAWVQLTLPPVPRFGLGLHGDIVVLDV